MSTPRLFFKGGFTLGSGQVVSQFCSFLRNVIVARLISPQNYGIAATFAMTFYLVEMTSNLGMENLLIQSVDGDEPRFEGTAHLILVLRGLLNATLIFLLAGPISSLFGVPQARWAFRCLALTPFIRGWNHLDTIRYQRGMRFTPGVTVDMIANIAVTVVALPLCWWLRDYSAMLWILVLQALISRVGSSIAAERHYRWAWDPVYAHQIFAFGWPLLINGLLMYGILQGDRFVIGSAHRLFSRSPLTLVDLGVYSVAFALTMAPTSLVMNVSGPLFLPHLSRAQKIRDQFERRYLGFSQVISLVAGMISIPFIAAGGTLIILIYGQKYAAAATFIGWLAAMWALRTARGIPTAAAMALGDTRNAMVSNIVRTLALAGVLTTVAMGGGLIGIAVCGLLGEVLALAVCVGRLRREHGIPVMLFVRPFTVCAVGMALAGIVRVTITAHFGWLISLAAAAGLVLLQFLGMLIAYPGLRKEWGQIISKAQIPVATENVPA